LLNLRHETGVLNYNFGPKEDSPLSFGEKKVILHELNAEFISLNFEE
jgi:hypothetical protein